LMRPVFDTKLFSACRVQPAPSSPSIRHRRDQAVAIEVDGKCLGAAQDHLAERRSDHARTLNSRCDQRGEAALGDGDRALVDDGRRGSVDDLPNFMRPAKKFAC